MKRITKLSGLLVALLILASALPVYGQGVVSLSIDELQFPEFPTAKASVTVRNENGVPIGGLQPQKFEIVEDGQTSFPPSQVEARVNPDASVSVVMVIDISGSMDGKPIEEAMRAANTLLDQLSPQDRSALIAFADEVQDLDPSNLEEGKEVGFTPDKNEIRNAVNFLDEKIGWDTPLYDAIYKGVKMASTEPVGKRAVIVMTDGRDERDNAQGVAVKDEGSVSTPDDPILEANRHNIPIFSVGLADISGKIDTKYLTRLAERTGGLYQEAPAPEELTPMFERVLNQLKQQYVLTYQSTLPSDGSYHSLLVRVQLPQGQAWGETKFQVVGDSPPDAGATPQETVVARINSDDSVEVAPQATPESSSGGLSGIIDTVRDTVQERPALAIIILAGVLLLLILIIALLVVLMRGRQTEEDEFVSADFGETYAPPPQWSPEPSGPPTPAMGMDMGEKTEVAPSGWSEPAAPPPPPPPPPDVGGGPEEEVEFPEAGSTRVIERQPKHLAMLVDKSHPDKKYDIKGTANIGRARDNDIVLEDPTVSRNHAWIKSEGEEFVVFDIGSGNGTFVNDERVNEPRALQNGDTVRFGDAAFVFTQVF